MTARWTSASSRGSAAAFHAQDPEPAAGRAAWWFEVDAPALVLGSAQSDSSVDGDLCAQEGIDVVRRRSGGGAVLMIPDEIVWVDFLLPADDPLAVADIGRSMWWVGEVWASALESLGVAAPSVHRGPLVTSEWSRLVCFDGLGPGEVLIDRRKAVGVSQRRTRSWSRLQTAVHLRWRADLMDRLIPGTGSEERRPTAPWTLPPNVTARDVSHAVDTALASL